MPIFCISKIVFSSSIYAAFAIQSNQIEVEKFLIMKVFHQLNKEGMHNSNIAILELLLN